MDYMSSLSSTKRGNDCVFVVVDRFSKVAILAAARSTSQQKPLSISSLNEYGYILGSHKPLSQTMTISSSDHSGRASGHYLIPSSPNLLPSTPRQMAKLRLSIRWSYITYACTIKNTPTHGMRVFPMSNIDTTDPCIDQLATTPFRWVWDSNHWAPGMLHYPWKPP
jgi:hypothetical protein